MEKRWVVLVVSLVALGFLLGYLLSLYQENKISTLTQEASAQSEAWVLYNNGHMEGAIIEFLDYLDNNQKNRQAHLGLGWAYLATEKYTEAKEAFNVAILLDPSDPSGYVGLGWTSYKNKEYSLAIESFNKARNLRSSDLGVYDGLGRSYFKVKEYGKAIEMFTLAEQVDNQLVFPKVGKFLSYSAKGDLLSAEMYLDKMIPFPTGKMPKTSGDLKYFVECVDVLTYNQSSIYECSRWW